MFFSFHGDKALYDRCVLYKNNHMHAELLKYVLFRLVDLLLPTPCSLWHANLIHRCNCCLSILLVGDSCC